MSPVNHRLQRVVELEVRVCVLGLLELGHPLLVRNAYFEERYTVLMLKVDKGGQRWTKVDKGGQRWTKVDKGGQRWTKVDKGGQRWTKVRSGVQIVSHR